MKQKSIAKKDKRLARIRRVRQQISGTKERPRAAVKRSLRHIGIQFIDDTVGKTLLAVSDKDLKAAKGTKTELARQVGELAAEKAQAAKITNIVFDRRSYAYHGRVQALAEGMREKGLSF